MNLNLYTEIERALTKRVLVNDICWGLNVTPQDIHMVRCGMQFVRNNDITQPTEELVTKAWHEMPAAQAAWIFHLTFNEFSEYFNMLSMTPWELDAALAEADTFASKSDIRLVFNVTMQRLLVAIEAVKFNSEIDFSVVPSDKLVQKAVAELSSLEVAARALHLTVSELKAYYV